MTATTRRSIGKSNLAGQRFGHLTVIQFTDEIDRRGYRLWLCRCDCGNERVYSTARLTDGATLYCGRNGCTAKTEERRRQAERRGDPVKRAKREKSLVDGRVLRRIPCVGKRRFGTAEEAITYLREIIEREADTANIVYACPICSGFHLAVASNVRQRWLEQYGYRVIYRGVAEAITGEEVW